MKKFLKWTGITIGVLFLLLLIAPFLFKDKIEAAIKQAANDNLNAQVDWSDVSLSLIRNFPNLRIAVSDLSVKNTVAPFDSLQLAKIGSLEAVVDIKSLFGDEIQIKRIGIINPVFDVRVTKEGLANYDIAKPDTVPAETPAVPEEASAFKMKLKEYFIENGTVNYDDQTMPMVMKFEGLNHSGSGDFTQDIFKLVTETTADKATFWFDGVTYLNEVKTNLQADIEMDMKNSKYTLAGNVIKLNELELGAQGWVAMPGEDIDMDISFKALKNDFKQFLSMVPMEFAKDVSGVDASGNLALDGYVRGKYNDASMPGIGLNLLVENARFKYPDLPKSVENINIKTAIVADMNVMDNTTVDVEKFHLEMAENPVDMTLKLRTPESDPFIDFMCKAFVNLDNVKEFIPLEKGDDVHGQINADLAVKGNYSTVESGNYEGFDAHGMIDIKNVLFKSDSMPYDLNVNTATFNFSPAFVDLQNFNAKIGRSDVQAAGKITNYLAYALRDSLLVGNFNVSSSLMDLNEFMTEDAATSTTTTASTESAPAAESSTMSAIELPGNIDFNLDASFAKMIYDVNEITNVKGGITLRNKTATLRNLAMNVLEGTVIMSGNYYAQDLSKPKMDMVFDIKDMDINKAANQFNTIDKMAPIAKACNGRFTTKFGMKCDLTQEMMPINNTVNGSGGLSTKNVTLKDFAPLVKLADKINLEKLKQPQTITDINVSFKIVDGVVNVDPFTVKMIDGIPMKVSGYTTLDQDINYNVDMDVPFDKFPSGAVNQANTWIGELNKKLGSNLSVGSKVNVIALITGTVTDPKVGVTSKALGADAVAGLKEQAVEA
ncbi:MAG: AsmA-like C-terminal region-containing protein, partial [Flavobacteriales bacterium]